MKNTKKLAKWDPCLGWSNDVYYLGTNETNKPFWKTRAKLFNSSGEVIHAAPGRIAAGSFYSSFYFGSYSIDYQANEYMDQGIYACDTSWNLKAEFRPSVLLDGPNNLFGNKLLPNGKVICAFRDPCVMPNGLFAVCTGGFRWNAKGNICSVSFDGNSKFTIKDETIIDDSLRQFEELERPTFLDDWMFFSTCARGRRFITCAAKLKNGLYHLDHEVAEGVYGFQVISRDKVMYWVRADHSIIVPTKPNLFYTNSKWSLLR